MVYFRSSVCKEEHMSKQRIFVTRARHLHLYANSHPNCTSISEPSTEREPQPQPPIKPPSKCNPSSTPCRSTEAGRISYLLSLRPPLGRPLLAPNKHQQSLASSTDEAMPRVSTQVLPSTKPVESPLFHAPQAETHLRTVRASITIQTQLSLR